ncbi:hypothetical protein CBOM_07879 [Ceraceosorus bombacis]|uniref:Uncharacterized protein n=1 Tax=Ceraceosorus bombacis TaxID=401625 RepID=A0A0P1BJ47_9BASI|nr:hypothetical protein CBOM_07879 [Ceraceosorus bombacis]
MSQSPCAPRRDSAALSHKRCRTAAQPHLVFITSKPAHLPASPISWRDHLAELLTWPLDRQRAISNGRFPS